MLFAFLSYKSVPLSLQAGSGTVTGKVGKEFNTLSGIFPFSTLKIGPYMLQKGKFLFINGYERASGEEGKSGEVPAEGTDVSPIMTGYRY